VQVTFYQSSQDNPEQAPGAQKTWKGCFERNPRLTLGIFLFLVFLGLIFITENILAHKVKSLRYRAAATRYIILKEYSPSEILSIAPPPGIPPQQRNALSEKYVLRLDQNGFIQPSQIHAKPDLVLAFLGGATTECLYVPELKRFPYLAGRIIEQDTGLKVNSYNAAKSLNNSLHSINILMNKILPLKPDVVVLMHNLNDLTTLICDQSYWNKDTSSSPVTVIKPGIIATIANTLEICADQTIPRLAWELKNVFGGLMGRSPQPLELRTCSTDRSSLDQTSLLRRFKMNLATFVNICQARQITPVLMTEPYRFKDLRDSEPGQQNNDSAFKELFTEFNQAIREAGTKNRVQVIDLAPRITLGKDHLDDLGNVTGQGSQSMAQIIAADLKPLILSRRPLSLCGEQE
jgi:hypothetical protein